MKLRVWSETHSRTAASPLFSFGNSRSPRPCGVQRGDLNDPLLFALAIHDMYHGGSADLTWLVEYGRRHFWGTSEQVIAEDSSIMSAVAKIGLLLHVSSQPLLHLMGKTCLHS